jgi:hypothetical protein
MRMTSSQKSYDSTNPKAPDAGFPPQHLRILCDPIQVWHFHPLLNYSIQQLVLLNDCRVPKPQAQGCRQAILNDTNPPFADSASCRVKCGLYPRSSEQMSVLSSWSAAVRVRPGEQSWTGRLGRGDLFCLFDSADMLCSLSVHPFKWYHVDGGQHGQS